MIQIDTTLIYEEFNNNYYEGFQKQENVLARYNYNNPNTIYDVYRFYGNGCYCIFLLDRNKPVLTKEMFDPNYTGWRGVLYKEKNKIMGDLFTQIGQMSWELGKEKSKFSIKGDTLIVKVKSQPPRIYLKRQIDKKLLEPRADW